eukprot:COSAG02_NODE_494_length_21161_cov_48.367534_3_plen_674_part_00
MLLSQSELGKVGRSKALCAKTRAFVADWTDGHVDSWFNQLVHTDAKSLVAWDILTASERAKKLRTTQQLLGHGRCFLEGATVRCDGTPVPKLLSEEDVASLCLALVSASVAKGHGFVSGSVVVEDPGHKLLAALSTAPGAYERHKTVQGSQGGVVDAHAVGSPHMLDMIRWTSLHGVVDTTDDTGPLKFPCAAGQCLGTLGVVKNYPIELEPCKICGAAPDPDYADRLLTKQARSRVKTQVRSAYDVFAAEWEKELGDLPLREVDNNQGDDAVFTQTISEEVMSRRLREDRKVAEAPQRRNATAEEWRGYSPEDRALFEHAAAAALADAEAGRAPTHTTEDVKALLRVRDVDLGAEVSSWWVGAPGELGPYAQFGYDFGSRPLLATAGGWVSPTIVFGKAPIYPGNDDGWAQATLVVWEIDVEGAISVDNPTAVAMIQSANPAKNGLRRPPSRGADSLSLAARSQMVEEHANCELRQRQQNGEETGSQVNVLALDNILGVPQHVRYIAEQARLAEQQRWVPVGPCRSTEQRPDSEWVRKLRDARAKYGLDPDRDMVAHAHELRAAVGAQISQLETELATVASADQDSTEVTSSQATLVDQLLAAKQQLQASNDFLSQGCRCWMAYWHCDRAVKELEEWCTGRSEVGAQLARSLRRELLESLSSDIPQSKPSRT